MRLILTTLALLILFPNMNAQHGLSAGLSTQLINTRMVDFGGRNIGTKGAYRPATNLFVEYELGRRCAFQTGLGYAMMTQNSDQFKNNFHYLAMPLYFKIGRLSEDKRIAFNTLLGTNLHYLFGAQHVYQDETRQDIIDLSQRYHFDVVVEAGINIKISEKIRLDVYTILSAGSYINKITPAQLYLNNLNSGYGANLCYKIR